MKRNDFGFPSAPVADDRMAWGEAVYTIEVVLERVKLQQKLNKDSDNPMPINVERMKDAWERILQG